MHGERAACAQVRAHTHASAGFTCMVFMNQRGS